MSEKRLTLRIDVELQNDVSLEDVSDGITDEVQGILEDKLYPDAVEKITVSFLASEEPYADEMERKADD